MNNIEIKNPWLGFIAIPLIIIVIVFFFRIPKMKRKLLKNRLSLGLHILMSITLSLAFMDIRFLHSGKNTELFILADCSDSEKTSSERIDQLIEEVYDKQAVNTKIGVVAFAKDQRLVTSLGAEYKGISRVFEDNSFDGSVTNLEAALNYTQSLYSEESVRRLLIISDGAETDGSAINSLDKLLNDNVYIDCVYLSEEEGDEIAVTNVAYTEKAFYGRKQEAKVSIRSRKEGQITAALSKNGNVVESKKTQVNKGLTILNFELPSEEVGTFEYKISLLDENGSTIPESKDIFKENNQKSFTQEIKDDFKVLLIDNGEADRRAIEALHLFTENTEITEYLHTANNLPYTLDKIIQYDEIILSDVNLENVPHKEEFVDSLRLAVSVYGKTLMNYGATNIGSASNEGLSLFSDMLPVQYHSEDKQAVVLNIDVSGSMDGDRLAKAKQGAAACIDILDENDYIGIVSFSDEGLVVQPLTSVKNKATILANINSMETIGGTNMGPGFTRSVELLRNADFEYKQVITLSDGDPFDSPDDLRNQVRQMSDMNIISSFINISNKSGEALLKSLANVGNGRYYYVDTAASLVKVMLSSVTDDVQDTSVVGRAAIQIREEEDPSLEGITSLPDLMGYNYCRIKSDATTVLTTQYTAKDGDSQGIGVAAVPIYAYWSFGKGKVSSFTSAIGTSWTTGIRSMPEGKLFFQNAAKQMLPDSASDEQITFEYELNGASALAKVNANDGDTAAEVKLTLTHPNGESKDYTPTYDGSGYSVLLDTPSVGDYKVHIVYNHHVTYNNGEVHMEKLGEVDYPLHFDYSKEYNLFEANDGEILYRLSAANGSTTVNEVNYETLSSEIEYRSFRSSMMWLLFASLAIFLADVFIRKSEFKRKSLATA
ncbi:MAG: VWA domain-containing protein [Bacilli bacterium]|nr:VWA domain-containing protein [Bacilli bacterium]